MFTRSLKFRFALTVFLFGTLITLCVLWATLSASLRQASRQLEAADRVIAGLLAQPSELALLASDYGELQALLEESVRDARLLQVDVADASGRVVASSAPARIGQALGRLDDAGPRRWHRVPLANASGALGVLALLLSEEPLERAYREALKLGIGVALLGMLALVALGFAIGALLTRRLERLVQVADQLAGGADPVGDDPGDDEVAVLERALARLTHRIQLSLEALRSSQRQISLLLDSTAEAIFGVDLEDRCTFANPACARMLGYEAQELIGQSMHALIHHTRADGRPYPTDECPMQRALRSGGEAHLDAEVLWRKDGTRFVAQYWSHPVRDGGQLVGAVVTFFDATERVRAQQALALSEARFRDFAEIAADWFWEMDTELRFSSVSGRFGEVMGIDVDEVLGKTRGELHGGGRDEASGPEDWATHFENLRARKAFRDFELRWTRPDGDARDIAISGRPVYDARGMFSGFRGVGRDITALKAAQRFLRQSERRFRDFAEMAADWFWEMDAELRFTYLSGRFEQVLGIRVGDLLGRSRAEFHAGRTDVESPAWRAHLAMLARREPFNDFEFEWHASGGARHIISITGRPRFDASGEFQGYHGVGRDVTVQRDAAWRLQELLQENRGLTRGMLNAQESERRRLALELHDEVGQALTAIQADTETLRLLLPDADERMRACVSGIHDASVGLYEVMHSVMERLHPAVLEDLGLAEALRDLVQRWGRRYPAVRCTLELADGLDVADEWRIALYRIAQECLTNVARHAQASEVRVRLAPAGEGRGSALELCIEDDGVGFDLQRPRAGLGLLGVSERAELAGGTARFHSTPGGGFRVTVTLPSAARAA